MIAVITKPELIDGALQMLRDNDLDGVVYFFDRANGCVGVQLWARGDTGVTVLDKMQDLVERAAEMRRVSEALAS